MNNQIEQNYRERTKTSNLHYKKACEFMPGGETRTTVFHKPYPLFVEKGKGSKFIDSDENIYLDALNNYTSMIHGHAHPLLIENVTKAINKGVSFATGLTEQTELAEILCGRVPSIESIRFTNSGTEASFLAIRTARAYKRKMGIITIKGGYHGTHDFVAKYNSSLEASGIPKQINDCKFEVPFNNINKIKEVLEKNHHNIAAIIIEPILGAGGVVTPTEGYLQEVRKLTKEYNVLLILDEVQTLRIDYGGAQKAYDITPDITILGKIIGGGFPIGAFGGKKEIMELFSSESNPLLHGGTFNGNKVSMIAGITTMKLLTEEVIQNLNKKASYLKKEMLEIAKDQSTPFSITQAGSLLNFHFLQNEPINVDEISLKSKKKNSLLHLSLLNKGVFIAPRGSFNLSTAWDQQDVQYFIKAFELSIQEVKFQMKYIH